MKSNARELRMVALHGERDDAKLLGPPAHDFLIWICADHFSSTFLSNRASHQPRCCHRGRSRSCSTHPMPSYLRPHSPLSMWWQPPAQTHFRRTSSTRWATSSSSTAPPRLLWRGCKLSVFCSKSSHSRLNFLSFCPAESRRSRPQRRRTRIRSARRGSSRRSRSWRARSLGSSLRRAWVCFRSCSLTRKVHLRLIRPAVRVQCRPTK